MHGTGNRILIVDQRERDSEVPGENVLKRLGDPATGLGFDQLMWVESAQDPSARAAYRVFNADGSEVEQCGNGLRCVAWWLARDGAREFSLESPAGLVDATVGDDDQVAVSMGSPVFEPARVPFDAEQKADSYPIDVDGTTYEVSVVSMGNPHCVLIVDDVSAAPVNELGAMLETHPRFPHKTNVGFMEIRDRGHISLRVFERGVGETAACGSGACAAVVSGIRSGYLDDDVEVQVPGGKLMVSSRPNTVWLTGQVELINEGSIDL
ncbi:MAG: diaminopimelate epimerase [Woeseiaceae bacterium]|nr:diaminopimelate epimerase [Woeseiaceae bacterium]